MCIRDSDYITQWSYGIDETLTLLIPDFKGGSSAGKLSADSDTAKKLKSLGVPNSVSYTHLDVYKRQDDPHDMIHVTISYRHKEWIDKSTGEIFPIYDYRQERVWRHLDSMEHATFIHCRLPRIQTSDGKTHTIEVVWADSGISHTKKLSLIHI